MYHLLSDKLESMKIVAYQKPAFYEVMIIAQTEKK